MVQVDQSKKGNNIQQSKLSKCARVLALFLFKTFIFIQVLIKINLPFSFVDPVYPSQPPQPFFGVSCCRPGVEYLATLPVMAVSFSHFLC